VKKKRSHHKIGGQFAPRLSEMLRSPAFRVLSLTGHRILARIEIELANHGGRDNGKLPVTYRNLKDFGICNRTDIARGKRELCALGFIECTRGHAGNGEFRRPTLFRLTYLPAYGKSPTHEWRQIETPEEAESIAKKVRRRTNEKNKTPVTKNVTRSSRKTRRYPVTFSETMPPKHRSRFSRRLSRQSSHLERGHQREGAPDLPPCPDLTAADLRTGDLVTFHRTNQRRNTHGKGK
jgi:hypothetical protein